MARYIKTGTTEFEQFNETKDQCFKFGIIDKASLTSVESIAYGDDRYTIPTLEGDIVIHPTDWIATGVNGEHWPVKDDIFQKVYKKLPVLNKGMARWLELTKQQGKSLGDLFTDFVPEQLTQDEANMCMRWVASIPDDNDRSNAVARAWLDGCEVAEVEK